MGAAGRRRRSGLRDCRGDEQRRSRERRGAEALDQARGGPCVDSNADVAEEKVLAACVCDAGRLVAYGPRAPRAGAAELPDDAVLELDLEVLGGPSPHPRIRLAAPVTMSPGRFGEWPRAGLLEGAPLTEEVPREGEEPRRDDRQDAAEVEATAERRTTTSRRKMPATEVGIA